MLTVTALFAGFSGALIAMLIKTDSNFEGLTYCIGLSIGALYCFGLTAELLTDALDDGGVDEYLRSMFVYNIGVILILNTLGLFLRTHGYLTLGWVLVALCIFPWGKDTLWFIFASKKLKQNYKDSLKRTA